jgi:hypothetical protein
MPILIQCTSCSRKLRVPEHLLGKTVKCPNCQAKFQAQQVADSSAPPTVINPPPLPPAPEEPPPTPVVPPITPAATAPAVQTLELPEPALKPTPAAPRSKERVTATVEAPAPPVPAPPAAPPPFPTPPLRVFAVLGAILLLTTLVGLGLSWWISAAVHRAVEARQQP